MPETKNVQVSSKTYNRLKPVAQVYLPGLAALYSSLAAIWGFPNPEGIVGTIAAINVFLGLTLGLSSKNYHEQDLAENADGAFIINHTDPEAETIGTQFNVDPLKLGNKKELRMQVIHDSQTKHGL